MKNLLILTEDGAEKSKSGKISQEKYYLIGLIKNLTTQIRDKKKIKACDIRKKEV